MTTQHPTDHEGLGDRPAGAQECGEPREAGREEPCAVYDYIDETIEESMDASDPPSFTPHTTVGPPGHGAGTQPAGRG